MLARPRRTLRAARAARAVAATLAVVSLLGVAACSGEDDAASNSAADSDDDGEASPTEVLAYAAQLLDETSGVTLSLSTDDDPGGDAFLRSATGTIVADPPAFEGTASGRLEGFDASDIGIVSVDGDFQVDVPVAGWTSFDPATLCAPDPAVLLDPETGVGTVLTEATDLAQGDSERGGPDNAEVLTTYTGSVPGTAVTNVLPCAPGEEFDATFTINADGYLRSAVLTGQFFSGGGDLTYTVDVEDYDVTKDIQAP